MPTMPRTTLRYWSVPATVALIAVVLAGFVVEVAHGHSGRPYDMIGAVGGLTYVAALGWFRVRG